MSRSPAALAEHFVAATDAQRPETGVRALLRAVLERARDDLDRPDERAEALAWFTDPSEGAFSLAYVCAHLGIEPERVRRAALRVALLWQIAVAEEEALGPADASSIAYGRIPLAHLTKRETAGRAPRARAG